MPALKPKRGAERPIKRLYTIQEAGDYLGRSVGAVREMIYSGKIPEVRIDRRVQVDVHDLDVIIEQSKTQFGG